MTVRIRPLSKILSGQPYLDRVQDHFIAILNAFMVEVAQQATSIPRYSTSGRPPPSSTLGGSFIRVKDNNQPELLQLCMQNSSGGWEWVTVAMSS